MKDDQSANVSRSFREALSGCDTKNSHRAKTIIRMLAQAALRAGEPTQYAEGGGKLCASFTNTDAPAREGHDGPER